MIQLGQNCNESCPVVSDGSGNGTQRAIKAGASRGLKI